MKTITKIKTAVPHHARMLLALAAAALFLSGACRHSVDVAAEKAAVAKVIDANIG